MTQPPPWQSAYDAYVQDKKPEMLHAVVKQLQPSIQHTLQVTGSSGDPYMQARAHTIAGKAVQTYDATKGAGLSTWVSQQLQQLARIRRQSQTPMKLPDRLWLDHMQITKSHARFVDQNNREPDAGELADASKISVKRIETVRRQMRKMPSEGTMNAVLGAIPGQDTEDGPLQEATRYVYEDSDHTDRQILEMRTGYGGRYEPMAPNDIASSLNIHPSQITRRGLRLQLKIHDLARSLENLQ